MGQHLVYTVLLLTILITNANGHIHLIEPHPRQMQTNDSLNSENATRLNCGTSEKCGICGDHLDDLGPLQLEYDGKQTNDTITRSYNANKDIIATVEWTPQCKGYIEFRLCPVLNSVNGLTQECLDKYVLQLQNGNETRFQLPNIATSRFLNVSLHLPHDLTCAHCVLQFIYKTVYSEENEYSKCQDERKNTVECEAPEEYRTCADISIVNTLTTETTSGDGINQTTKENQLPISQQLVKAKVQPFQRRIFRSRRTNDNCKAVREGKDRPGMDGWCNSNCHHNPPHCPTNFCECGDHNSQISQQQTNSWNSEHETQKNTFNSEQESMRAKWNSEEMQRKSVEGEMQRRRHSWSSGQESHKTDSEEGRQNSWSTGLTNQQNGWNTGLASQQSGFDTGLANQENNWSNRHKIQQMSQDSRQESKQTGWANGYNNQLQGQNSWYGRENNGLSSGHESEVHSWDRAHRKQSARWDEGHNSMNQGLPSGQIYGGMNEHRQHNSETHDIEEEYEVKTYRKRKRTRSDASLHVGFKGFGLSANAGAQFRH